MKKKNEGLRNFFGKHFKTNTKTQDNGLEHMTIKDNLIKAEEYFFEKLHREIDDEEEE